MNVTWAGGGSSRTAWFGQSSPSAVCDEITAEITLELFPYYMPRGSPESQVRGTTALQTASLKSIVSRKGSEVDVDLPSCS